MRAMTSARSGEAALALASASFSSACTSADRSSSTMFAPTEASKNASRPRPAVASTTVGSRSFLKPAALTNGWSRPLPRRKRKPTAPPAKSRRNWPVFKLMFDATAKSLFGVKGKSRYSSRPALSAAVDPQHLARDECAERTREDFHHARDLIDGGDAVERAGLGHSALIDGARSQKPAGPGIARRDAVDGDVVRPQLIGKAARVMRHAGFCHRIDRGIGAALESGDRADGDNAAAAAFHHAAGDRLAGQDRAEQVAIEHRAHVGLLDADRVVRIG